MDYELYEQGCTVATEALLSGKGIKHIFRCIKPFFQNPLLLSDGSFRILESINTDYPDDRFLTEIIKTGFYPAEYISAMKSLNLLMEVNTPTKRNEPLNMSEKSYLTVDLEQGDKFYGFITLVEEVPFTETEKKLFEYLRKIILTEMRSAKDERTAYKRIRMQDHILRELLDGELTGVHMRARLEQGKLCFDNGKRLAKIRLPLGSEESARLEYHLDVLQTIFENNPCLIYKNAIVALVDEIPNGGVSDTLTAKLREYLQYTGLICGISNPIFSASYINVIYTQAEAAAMFGQFITKDGNVFLYERLTVYQVIDIISRTTPLYNFCSPHYMVMMAYDKKFSTEYVSTLSCYLDCFKDPVKTAEKMNVHRNTVNYRIKRIEDIFHISLDDSELIFNLMFTIRIMRSLKSLEDQNNEII